METATMIPVDPSKPYLVQVWDKAQKSRISLIRFVDRKAALEEAKKITRTIMGRPNVQVMAMKQVEALCTRGQTYIAHDHFYLSEPHKNQEMLYGRISLLREDTNLEKRKRKFDRDMWTPSQARNA